ncbi:MAG: Low molecular weight protein-tyrosine-phosphatase YwlE [Actinomycetota bacterium]
MSVSNSDLNILFVCTGNTCRSPMAEQIFNQEALDVSAHATSAGLDAQEGSPINPHAIEALKGLGYSSTEHSSKLLSTEAVEAADVILTFTQSQKIELGQRFPAASGKLFTISEYANSGLDKIEDVPDPYGESQVVYQETAERIASLVKVIVGSLKNS